MKGKIGIALVALIIGCTAGIAARDTVMPIAQGQATSTYQHYCTELKWEDVLGKQNLKPELGQKGWELATFVSAEEKGFGGTTTRIVACFKREVQ